MELRCIGCPLMLPMFQQSTFCICTEEHAYALCEIRLDSVVSVMTAHADGHVQFPKVSPPKPQDMALNSKVA
ncbi:hypothetical protein A0U95_00840 [Pseudomonas brassicacearum]|nr:hypothetical protein A0U95_00840 [Pseudomonas brassicacearum]